MQNPIRPTQDLSQDPTLKQLKEFNAFLDPFEFWVLGFFTSFTNQPTDKHITLLKHLQGLSKLNILKSDEKLDFIERYLITYGKTVDLTVYKPINSDFDLKKNKISSPFPYYLQEVQSLIPKSKKLKDIYFFFVGKQCALYPSINLENSLRELDCFVSMSNSQISDNEKIDIVLMQLEESRRDKEKLKGFEKKPSITQSINKESIDSGKLIKGFDVKENKKPENKVRLEDYYYELPKTNFKFEEKKTSDKYDFKKSEPKKLVQDEQVPECSICLQDLRDQPLIPLEDCQHHYHIPCLANYMQIRITDKNEKMQCPTCRKPIKQEETIMFLQYSGKNESLKQLTDMKLAQFEEPPKDLDNFKNCPRCGVANPVYPYEIKFTCVECNHKECLTCNSKWHDGINCRENQRKIEANKLQEYSKKNKLKSCPGCGVMIEVTGGRRITCPSCNSYFCFVCLTKFQNNSCACRK